MDARRDWRESFWPGSWDLNLLVAFMALYDERNVTRAGRRIGLSQPAMSAVLKRLRTLTRDDLFERTSSAMQPTPRAIEIAAPIRQALQQIRATLGPQHFDPSQAKRTFRLATTDLSASLLLGPLSRRAALWSRDINFEFIYSDGDNGVVELLQSGAADVAIGTFKHNSDKLNSVMLYEAPFACALRASHPLAKKRMTLETFAQAPQVIVSQPGDPSHTIDKILSNAGLGRRISFTVPHYLIVPFLLSRTDLIAVIPRKLVERFGYTEKLCIADAPFANLTARGLMMWAQSMETNPANVWLRGELIEIARNCRLDHWW
jgi:DNA-binding transcriptional LysR family regulator